LRLAVAEEQLGIEIELGGHAAAIPELRELAASYPLRERLPELLMLALYRTGRQADALAVFHDTRRLLGEQLGIDPGPALRGMHQRILEMDPTLLPVPRPAATDAAIQPAAARPVVPRPLVRPVQLPSDTPVLAGRDRELALLDGLLEEAGNAPHVPVIAAIDGMPGIGKTALAVHWAHQAAGRFPDGVLHADLRGLSPDMTLRAFLDALGVPPERVPGHRVAQAGLYRSLLHDRRLLILLDNAARAEDIRPLLPGTGGSMVIITSRSRLTGLTATHNARRVTLMPLPAEDSRTMLASRLHPPRAPAEPETVREIVDLCAGLPLALAVVAARVAAGQGQTLAAILSELRDPGTRLCALSTSDPAADICAAFALSYRQFSLPARRVLRELAQDERAVFTVTSAAALTGIPDANAWRLLSELTSACMLTERPAGRYVLHDLVRLYAALTSIDDAGHGQHVPAGQLPRAPSRPDHAAS
ncbi:MAG: BTAD domain-containing putative transcriptional regulator, partial [Trebonia sp.]